MCRATDASCVEINDKITKVNDRVRRMFDDFDRDHGTEYAKSSLGILNDLAELHTNRTRDPWDSRSSASMALSKNSIAFALHSLLLGGQRDKLPATLKRLMSLNAKSFSDLADCLTNETARLVFDSSNAVDLEATATSFYIAELESTRHNRNSAAAFRRISQKKKKKNRPNSKTIASGSENNNSNNNRPSGATTHCNLTSSSENNNTKSAKAIADTGTSGHYLGIKITLHLLANLKPTESPQAVQNANQGMMYSTHTGELPLPILPASA